MRRLLGVLAMLVAAAPAAAVTGAAPEITISVRPLVGPTELDGAVAGAREGEKVTIQFRQCGLVPDQFRDVAELTTHEGGRFSLHVGAPANGVFRALAGGGASNEVAVREPADLRLSPSGARHYVAYVVAGSSFWKRRVVLQRLDRRLGRWANLRTLILSSQSAAPGASMVWSSSEKFTVALPKGTSIRAAISAGQAKPCHVAAFSNVLRTR